MERTFNTVGGAHTHVVLETANIPPLYMGSLITLSYNVYRDKTPVFNCGNSVIDGFAIGNKYVAGSMITTMFTNDELADFMNKYSRYYEGVTTTNSSDTFKEIHTFMQDDLTEFTISIIFTSEYSSDATRVVLYDANFISNGQVMSIDDVITETTHQFVARDIRPQHDIQDPITHVQTSTRVRKGSNVLRGKCRKIQPDIVRRDSYLEFNNDEINRTS